MAEFIVPANTAADPHALITLELHSINRLVPNEFKVCLCPAGVGGDGMGVVGGGRHVGAWVAPVGRSAHYSYTGWGGWRPGQDGLQQ